MVVVTDMVLAILLDILTIPMEVIFFSVASLLQMTFMIKKVLESKFNFTYFKNVSVTKRSLIILSSLDLLVTKITFFIPCLSLRNPIEPS